MLGRVARWTVWLLVLWFALSFVPVILRMSRDQLATLGVFILSVFGFMIMGSILYPRGRRWRHDEDEGTRLLEWQNRETLDSYRSDRSDW